MSINIVELNHVNVTVPGSLEGASKEFYRDILGLEQIYKPDAANSRGAWYQIGPVQLHLSVEDNANQLSKRHVCFVVSDVDFAEMHLREAGVEILPDMRPIPGRRRFFVRDPGGNRIEIAQAYPETNNE